MSLACAPVRDLLSDHLDGRYPEGSPERDRIEAHLEACPACARILADYALLRRAAPGPERVADPAAFSRRLRERLRPPASARPLPWRPLAAAAALLLAFGIGWTLKPVPAPAAHPYAPEAPPVPRRPVEVPLDPVSTLPEPPEEPESPSWLGLSCRPLGGELASYLGLPPSTPGVVVGAVSPGSPAALAGLRPGDVLLTVDEVPVDVHSVRAAIREVPAGRILSLDVVRPGMARVTIPVQGTRAP